MRHSLFAAAACAGAAAVLAAQQPSERQTFCRAREILTIEASIRADGAPLAICSHPTDVRED